jgi:hypothetical protein
MASAHDNDTTTQVYRTIIAESVVVVVGSFFNCGDGLMSDEFRGDTYHFAITRVI